jgi:hypothetical protein
LKVVTETTGPKISSWKMRILLWPRKTVGSRIAAFEFAAQVRALAAGQHSAPSFLPMSM